MTEVKFNIDIETDMMSIAQSIVANNCLDLVKCKYTFKKALSVAFYNKHKDSMGHCNLRIWNVSTEEVAELKAELLPEGLTELGRSVRQRMEKQIIEESGKRYAHIGGSEMKQFQDAIDVAFGVDTSPQSGRKFDYSYEFNRVIECLDDIESHGLYTRLDQDIVEDCNTRARRKFKRGRLLKKDTLKGLDASAYTINVDAVVQDHPDIMDGIKVVPPVLRLSKEQGDTEFQMNRVLPDGTEKYMTYPNNLFAAVNELGSMLKRREAGAIKKATENAAQGRDLREDNGFYTNEELAILLQGVEVPEEQTYAVIDTGKLNEYSCSRLVTDAERHAVVEELFAAGRNPIIVKSGMTHAKAKKVEAKLQRSAALASKQKNVCERITSLREKLEDLVKENRNLSESKSANDEEMMELINNASQVSAQ